MRFVKFLLMILILMTPIPSAQAQSEPIAPQIFLRGLQLAQGVRYTASFVKPTDATVLRNISIELTLPADTRLTEMLVSKQVDFDVVRVNSAGELTLIWQILRVAGDTPFEPFAFTVKEPLSTEIEFYIEWQSEDRTQFFENFFELPPLVNASQDEGQISPTLPGFAFVMRTGVQVSAPAPEVPYIMNVRVLSTDFNPPAELGNIWWCSLLEINNLPANTQVEVIVPLRRPVAAFTALQLFHQQADGSWKALEGQAVVTADGQFAMYTHPGGIVATGGDDSIQLEVVTEGLPPLDEENTAASDTPAEDTASQEEETPTPAPATTGGATVQLSESAVLNPATPAAPVQPSAFGAGGVRVEVFTLAEGDFLQCQVGKINCVTLKRRLGAGFR